MKCDNCGHDIPDATIAKHLASKGGSVKGKSKARTSEQARAAVNARWEKYRQETAPKKKSK